MNWEEIKRSASSKRVHIYFDEQVQIHKQTLLRLQKDPETWKQFQEEIERLRGLGGDLRTRKRLLEAVEALQELGVDRDTLKTLQRSKVGDLEVFSWLRKALQDRSVAESPVSKNVSRLEQCRSVVGFAKRFLPREQRDDFADECLDEIEAAAEAERPVVRRTASILFRALPVLIIRTRLPTRARKAGAKGE